MVMDLPTIHQLITVILQPTRSNVSRCIVGHICVLAGGGEDGVASSEEMVERRPRPPLRSTTNFRARAAGGTSNQLHLRTHR